MNLLKLLAALLLLKFSALADLRLSEVREQLPVSLLEAPRGKGLWVAGPLLHVYKQ